MKWWIHFLSCFIPSQSKRKHFRETHLLPSFPVRYGKETAHNSVIVSPLGGGAAQPQTPLWNRSSIFRQKQHLGDYRPLRI